MRRVPPCGLLPTSPSNSVSFTRSLLYLSYPLHPSHPPSFYHLLHSFLIPASPSPHSHPLLPSLLSTTVMKAVHRLCQEPKPSFTLPPPPPPTSPGSSGPTQGECPPVERERSETSSLSGAERRYYYNTHTRTDTHTRARTHTHHTHAHTHTHTDRQVLCTMLYPWCTHVAALVQFCLYCMQRVVALIITCMICSCTCTCAV